MNILKTWVLVALLSLATSSFAGPTTTGVGAATVDDVKLNGVNSSQLAYSSSNPNQGPNGNDDGFVNEFTTFGVGEWTLIGKANKQGQQSNNSTDDGFNFTFNVTENSGTWSITNLNSAIFDLVLAIQTSNTSTAFIFNDLASPSLNGTWNIEWLKNGQTADFTTATLFARTQNANSLTPVPEPSELALMLLGLTVVGAVIRKRK